LNPEDGTTGSPVSLRWSAHGPEHTEAVAQLSPPVAPKHHLQRSGDLEAGGDGAAPPRFDVIDLKVQRVSLMRLERAAVLGIGVGKHERAAVDVQVYVHRPALV